MPTFICEDCIHHNSHGSAEAAGSPQPALLRDGAKGALRLRTLCSLGHLLLSSVSECEVERHPLNLQGDVGIWHMLCLAVLGHILRTHDCQMVGHLKVVFCGSTMLQPALHRLDCSVSTESEII